jgi:predicted ATPase/DNA-binding winged helix-turn-helix (wHTH) protein
VSEPVVYRFDKHCLAPASRSLLADGRPVKLGGRAFDLLVTLVERRERMVSKDELLDLVWPRLVVEENNLQVQVAALRKLLGAATIATVPGRGYRFTQAVTVDGPTPAAPPAPTEPAAAPLLLGRDDDLSTLLQALSASRLVTLAGSAGIGKTRLARAASAAWPHGANWVELASIADAAGVTAATARALGVGGGEDVLEQIARRVSAEPRLLVLDNAEHVLGGVAALATALLAKAPAARLLVTSQEVLRLPQESVLRLSPLSLPAGPGLAAAQDSGAVALFAARARAADRRFVLDAANADAVADICRRLDGIPLALELAAARLPLLGVAGLAARLDDRFRLLTTGARGALPRQQTLRAALEWSHALLGDGERRVLRRLGLFVGGFDIEGAQQLAADDTLDGWNVLEHLGTLVDKSLVLADALDPPRYRLLESTRLLALERLDEAGETGEWRRRHARAVIAVVQRVRGEARPGSAAVMAALAAEVDNARAALRWAASAADPAFGVALAAEASYAFMGANLHAEFMTLAVPWVEHSEHSDMDPVAAAALLRRVAAVGKNASHPLSLRAALRAAELLRAGAGGPRELHEALVVAVAVGARRGEALPFEELLAEAKALQRTDWPVPPLSNWHWARERWLMRAGRYEEAAAVQLAQAEAQQDFASVGAPQIALINAADNELAIGRVAAAEARARAAVQALEAVTAQRSAAGYGWGVIAACEAQRGAWRAALASCARACPLLEIEGDEALLLPVLAACAAGLGRAEDAARLAGHADAADARAGIVPWPAAAAERSRLQAVLAAALSAERLPALLAAGARLSRAEALALGLGSGG